MSRYANNEPATQGEHRFLGRFFGDRGLAWKDEQILIVMDWNTRERKGWRWRRREEEKKAEKEEKDEKEYRR